MNPRTALAGEYPFSPRDFKTPAGAQMRFLDEGPRSPDAVLMLHGNPTWSFYYRRLVRALAGSRRCIVPDHVGMGLSEKPRRYAYTLAGRIRDVEALVASLGPAQVDLVVHDWGGAIGFGFAGRHPGMIRRMVIMNTAAFPMRRIPLRIAVCRIPFLGTVLIRGVNAFAGAATRMAMHRRRLRPEEREGYLLPYGSWADRIAINAFVRDIPMRPGHPSWDTLAGVERGLGSLRDRPALIVWGGRDFCFDDAFLARWRKLLPGAAVRRIPDAGHYVLEDACDEAVGWIAEFLR